MTAPADQTRLTLNQFQRNLLTLQQSRQAQPKKTLSHLLPPPADWDNLLCQLASEALAQTHTFKSFSCFSRTALSYLALHTLKILYKLPQISYKSIKGQPLPPSPPPAAPRPAQEAPLNQHRVKPMSSVPPAPLSRIATLKDGLLLANEALAVLLTSYSANRTSTDTILDVTRCTIVSLFAQLIARTASPSIPETRSTRLLRIALPFSLLAALEIPSKKNYPWIQKAALAAAGCVLALRLKNIAQGLFSKPKELGAPAAAPAPPPPASRWNWQELSAIGLLACSAAINVSALSRIHSQPHVKPDELPIITYPAYQPFHNHLIALNTRVRKFSKEIGICNGIMNAKATLQITQPEYGIGPELYNWNISPSFPETNCTKRVYGSRRVYPELSKTWDQSLEKTTLTNCCKDLEINAQDWKEWEYNPNTNIILIMQRVYTKIEAETKINPNKAKFEQWRQTIQELHLPLFISAKEFVGFEQPIQETILQDYANKTLAWNDKVYATWLNVQQRIDKEPWERKKEFDVWLENSATPVLTYYFKSEYPKHSGLDQQRLWWIALGNKGDPPGYPTTFSYNDLTHCYAKPENFPFDELEDKMYKWYKDHSQFFLRFRDRVEIESQPEIRPDEVQRFESEAKAKGKFIGQGPYWGRRPAFNPTEYEHVKHNIWDSNYRLISAFDSWAGTFENWKHEECLKTLPEQERAQYSYPRHPCPSTN